MLIGLWHDQGQYWILIYFCVCVCARACLKEGEDWIATLFSVSNDFSSDHLLLSSLPPFCYRSLSLWCIFQRLVLCFFFHFHLCCILSALLKNNLLKSNINVKLRTSLGQYYDFRSCNISVTYLDLNSMLLDTSTLRYNASYSATSLLSFDLTHVRHPNSE